MSNGSPSWEPASSVSWARLLGMVRVPLFGSAESALVPGDHAVLQDGPEASFAFFAGGDGGNRLDTDDRLLSWSWSAHLRHALIVDPQIERMFLRRWDTPSLIRQFTLPQRGLGAEELLAILQTAPPPRTPTVIQHVLHGFRLIRQALPANATLEAIKLLNAFLLAAKAVRKGHVEREAFLKAGTFGEAIAALPAAERTLAQVDGLPQSLCAQHIDVLAHHFLDPEQRSGCELYSDLLFRHAASQLYQEAHLDVERDPQGHFAGLGPIEAPGGRLSKGVRYTPVNLARALVQQALAALGSLQNRATPLVVLDPACGSGVFLQECLRELTRQGVQGNVQLTGYDVSPLATYIANFCLEQAKTDVPAGSIRWQAAISRRNALECDWPEADLVLMNPPFIAWRELSSEDQGVLRNCLDTLSTGRPDMAMGFLRKAIEALKPGGVAATVLPAPLLDSTSGVSLREWLGERADILLLGRFEGYRYFAGSIVQPAFVLLRRKSPNTPPPSAVKVFVAEKEAEDAALRLLRVAEGGQRREDKRVDIFATAPSHFQAMSWLPQRGEDYRLRDSLDRLGLPHVNDLFLVRQGAPTGSNAAFVLRREDVEQRLLERERRFFRPFAGQGTVFQGRLVPRFSVFYPYDTSGLMLETEEELVSALPVYYKEWLKERKAALSKRRGKGVQWWTLSEPRAWQYANVPKLVSTYFGAVGSFAYDDRGNYAVVQGYAWLLKPARMLPAPRTTPDAQATLNATDLPWAYLALLNSGLFSRILACHCPKAQGGQFNLSARYVRDVRVPNLSDAQAPCSEVLPALAELGRRIHLGGLGEVRHEADRLSAQAYGLPDHS